MPATVTKGQDFYLFNNQIYIPPDLQEEVIQHIYSAKPHGHFGINKTHKRLLETYNFPQSRQKVKETLYKYTTCAQSKASRHKPYSKLQAILIPDKAWNSIALDFIIKLPISKEPITNCLFDSILVITDRLMKYSYFIPYKESINSKDLAYIFLRHIYSAHRLPDEIISDRGTTLTLKFWQSLMQQLGANHKLSTAFHPQTDRQTKRLNQTLEQYLHCYINYQQDNWVSLLPLAQFAYNSAPIETIKISPFYANYRFQPQAYRHPRDSAILAEKA